MECTEIEKRMLAARWAILEAGQLTWNYFQQGVTAEDKSDRTPVTIADREAEALLRDRLRKRFPNDALLGEEHGEESGTTGFRWIIDPIDATENFIRAIPIYANLVGLEFEGKVVAGLCNVPGFRQLYYAMQGAGAFRDDRRIHVSTIDALDRAKLIYSSLRYTDAYGVTPAFLDLERRVYRSRGFGDYYGYLLVAEGAAEIMVEPALKPWDMAAVKAIVEEAGGVFTDWTGADTIYGRGAVATNGRLHAQVLARLRGD